jgi:MFS family permease
MPQTVDVTELVGKAPFGRFQFGITALCALVAVLDGFDTQAIAYVAPVIAEQWHIDPSGFGPIFGAGLAGLMVGAFILSRLPTGLAASPSSCCHSASSACWLLARHGLPQRLSCWCFVF